MREHALTVKAVHDGPVCALTLKGDLDLTGTGGLLGPAALAVGNRTERLVLDLAGVTFLDCAGVRALAVAASFAPSGCPVIIRSLSPAARRILDCWPGRRQQSASLARASSTAPVRGSEPARTCPGPSRGRDPARELTAARETSSSRGTALADLLEKADHSAGGAPRRPAR